MALFESFRQIDPELDNLSKKGLRLLKEAGVVLPPNFTCIGLPWICYEDFTRDEGEKVDMEFFKGRIKLGGNINASELSSFPGGPVRLTVGRMSADPKDAGSITVGKTNLAHVSILSFAGITIGDNCTIGARVIIQDCDGHPIDRRLPDIVENKPRAPIVIEDNVWIGYAAQILKGVRIGHHAVIMPGAVVAKYDVPPYAVMIGNPAKNMKDL